MSYSVKKSRWFSGVIAVGALGLLLSACEIGNRSSVSLTGYDTISGYYSSLPQTIVFNATVGAAARTKNAPVNEMPDFLKAVMANPTLLFYDDPITHVGSVRSREDSATGIPTVINDRLSSFSASTAAYAELSGCRLQQDIVNSGAFSQLAATQVISGATVRGRLSLDYSLTYTLVGDDIDCNVMRGTFETCFTSNVGCSSDPGSIYYRAFVQEMFNPFISSGLVSSSEISDVRTLHYRATYQ